MIDAIQVRVDEVQPGVVPQWPSRRGLMCSSFSGSAQQRVVEQVDLADREIVRRAPVGVDASELLRGRGPVALLVLRAGISTSSADSEREPLVGGRPANIFASAFRRHPPIRRLESAPRGSRRTRALSRTGAAGLHTPH